MRLLFFLQIYKMSKILDKLKGMSEEKKVKFAVFSAIFITLLVLIFYLVVSSVFYGANKTNIQSKPIFDTKVFNDMKGSFIKLFNN